MVAERKIALPAERVDDRLELRLVCGRMAAEALEDVDAQRRVAAIAVQERPDSDAEELRAVVVAAEGDVADCLAFFVHGLHGFHG